MTYSIGGTLLKLTNVSLSYGEKMILRDINLEIKDILGSTQTTGQIISLFGRSGAGKSTLFKIIAGLLRPSAGEILIGPTQVPVEPGMVGMVLQKYPLFQHLTVMGNLQLVCKDKEKINTYLNDFDVYDIRTKYPQQLSGGQQQRVAIIQQLLSSEHFILLDEPFSGLDPVATEKLCANIIKVANTHDQNTVFISSHILEPALAVSDSAYMIGKDISVGQSVNGPVSLQGSTIKYHYDLAANGMAWNPFIKKDPRFTQLVEEIRNNFNSL